MRFNDQLQTVLAAQGDGASAASSLWRQCVDLLAQHDRADGPGMDATARAALLDRLRDVAGRIPETQRLASVVEIGSRLRSPALVRLFASDRPSVCVAAMSRARLPDAIWPELLAELGPTARGALRHRRDIGPETRRALEAFGSVDFSLSADELVLAQQNAVAEIESQPEMGGLELSPELEAAVDAAAIPAEEDRSIRKLVERIEAFTEARRERAAGERDKTPSNDVDGLAALVARHRHDWPIVARFAFETDADGVLVWVDAQPRGALVGLTIADASADGQSGPDGYALGAFRRRGAFRNARFSIADGSALAGDWRISGIPLFDQHSGRFQGYRGEARRPWPHEVPLAPASHAVQDIAQSLADPLGDGLPPDSVRQLVHELRTPLNAILGFAEIIENQLFGPASSAYRHLAQDIVGDARKLLSAFDDLDTASRLARGEIGAQRQSVDVPALLAAVSARFDAGGAKIDWSIDPFLEPVQLDPVQTDRMVQHLIRTLVSVSGTGERLSARCEQVKEAGEDRLQLTVDRPKALGGLEEAALLDPGYGPDGEWPDAPLLGVGFSLRLIRSLALGLGGRLDISANQLSISLPMTASREQSEGGQESL